MDFPTQLQRHEKPFVKFQTRSYVRAIFLLCAILLLSPSGFNKAWAKDASLADLRPADLSDLFNSATAGMLTANERRKLSQNARKLGFKRVKASGKRRNSFGRINLPSLGAGKSKAHIATGANVYRWTVDGQDLLAPQRNWFSQYVDDVFQFVITRREEGKKRRKGGWGYKDPAFIHQAGSYAKRENKGSKNHYSPTLRSELSNDGKSLYMLTWPQQAHVPQRLRSELLALTRLSQTKSGLLRIENVLFNTGSKPFDFVNAPWGGVRSKIFKKMSVDGDRAETIPTFKSKRRVVLSAKTGNAMWIDRASKTGFALVAPARWTRSDGSRGKTRFRYGVAGGKELRTQDRRNFSVGSNTTRIDFKPGDTMYMRYYLGFGSVKKLRAALSGYKGKLAVKTGSTSGGNALSCMVGTSNAQCGASSNLDFSRGTRPVFLFAKERRHGTTLSDDPYRADFKQWDQKGRDEPDEFLGFADPKNFSRLCKQMGLASSSGKRLICAAR